ncbi:hypothetical protein H112_04472 [Trichophyton rubrum D6]|uniref:Uncharacterized protein n=3 Tax=Trichophyton TaxID=5550 RepID=A0A178F3A7_TRIRU|nr:hypothetical protein H100_04482 [Trichophyton rubrum MR850]EZF41824.1 hypothetical protein H102_04465 [Trichophyton rubrum CBS 100081]EZF52408.1 hypothetical protein H103_04477 [Trichophyton rubrum CBS 288.86]EZF63100.1 hypothetical protein H104_04464 [Trichophyton rubrum CBS 289.86]EZF73684.1 hypothetical protein H105_04490 [Trichophyton soudanense CBS 452.61]EZF84407.1 hypothetical protein H110_04468 [Trichophyton rubrum MR1448]EZF95199.1 hypothetical protein H113_04508 [Trichophyton rub
MSQPEDTPTTEASCSPSLISAKSEGSVIVIPSMVYPLSIFAKRYKNPEKLLARCVKGHRDGPRLIRPEPPETSDKSDPPASLLNSHPPPEELDNYDNASYLDSDSDAISIDFESEDSFHKHSICSYLSVTSDEIVCNLDDGSLMPQLIEAYDMLFPNELENGITDGTISLDISLEEDDDDSEEDEDSSSASSDEMGPEDINQDVPRPGIGEKKRFVERIFTWMKRVPATDESELSVSLSEKNPSERALRVT